MHPEKAQCSFGLVTERERTSIIHSYGFFFNNKSFCKSTQKMIIHRRSRESRSKNSIEYLGKLNNFKKMFNGSTKCDRGDF